MRRVLPLAVAVTVPLALALARPADEAKPEPGLKPGQEVPGSFRPYVVTGSANAKDRFHSLVVEYGLDPVVLVVARRPHLASLEPLVKQLDDAVKEYGPTRLLRAFVVVVDGKNVVTDDDSREEMKDEVQQLASAAKLQDESRVPLCIDGEDDLKDYKLSEQAAVTLFFYREYKVKASYALGAEDLKDKEAAETLTAKVLADGLAQLFPPKSDK